MITFKRKAYDKLLEWKRTYADRYSILLEGPRRVGKSTIVETFVRNEYDSFILIDFSQASREVLACFDDISNLNLFFLRLQAATGVQLHEHRSATVFDEIQLFPRARQAIKHLVKDGRYHYIETGSLISIKKNVKDILIPSEEMKLQVSPMDYEEFLWACGSNTFEVIRELYQSGHAVGQDLNRKLMKDFRLYMAVGGMPQAVEAYLENKSFAQIDQVKRSIISLYIDDFKKIDPSGKIGAMYSSIPAQLSRNAKRFFISEATGKRKTDKDDERIFELLDSKTVLVCRNTTDPHAIMPSTMDADSYKLFLADTGLFVTLLFYDRPVAENTVYEKLLSDKLPANLGYLYENAVAQVFAASGRDLYYHTWDREGSTHSYEVDFLLSRGTKTDAVEVKSSGTGKHDSLDEFARKYSDAVGRTYVLSQKDVKVEGGHRFLPVYMAEFL
ncbi:MAG: ATP-binding protein [Eggerthellaceae bacterium]|nr:ATP-binding protein [Eggerthellaceae bacterium]